MAFRADLIVDNSLLLQSKAVDHLLPRHIAQVAGYSALPGIKRGLLVNFNAFPLKLGTKRISISKNLFLRVLRVLLNLRENKPHLDRSQSPD